MEFKKKKYHILWSVYSNKYYYLPYFLQIFQYYRATKTISSYSTHSTLSKKEYRSIWIKLCHIYVTRSKKKRRICESSYEFNQSLKPIAQLVHNFVSYPPANPIPLIFAKIVLERNQILNGRQIWSTAAYNSLMVRTYIFETRIPISPWRRSFSLSLFTDLFTNATVNRAMRYVWPFPALRETYIYLDGAVKRR